MNLIIENSEFVDYYTYLDPIFSSIPEFREMAWLISDLEVNYCTDSRLHNDPVLIDGESLNEIVQKDKIQFIWAVLSGYIEKPRRIPKDLPYADGNPNFWKGTPKPQAVGAEIEIVCWDSTCTLLINVNEHVKAKLKELYPDIRDLDKDNETRC